MGLSYKKYFTLRIHHDYYTEGYGDDFEIYPMPETQAFLKRHKQIFRPVHRGFDVLSMMSTENTPFIAPDSDQKLSFGLRLKNLYFTNFTVLPAKNDFKELYQFENKGLDDNDMEPADWKLVTPQNNAFLFAVASNATKVELQIHDPQGTLIHDQIMETSGDEFIHYFDRGSRLSGKYKFTVKEDNVAKAPVHFYLADHIKKLKPFGILDFFTSELNFNSPKNYVLHFDPKESQWTYQVNLQKDYTGSVVTLVDNRESPEITFKSTGNTSLLKGKVLTFESFQANDQNAKALIPFEQSPIDYFQLVITKNGDQTVMKNLPNPSVREPKSEIHINI